jgi:hypothetical protein
VSRGRRSSRRGPSILLAVLGVVVFATGLIALVALRPPRALVADWVPLGVPPMVYAILALLVIRRFAVVRLLAAMVGPCVLHALLFVLAEALGPSLAMALGRSGATALSSSALLSALTLIAVPMMLAPLRPLIVPRSRYTRPAPRVTSGAQRVRNGASGPSPLRQPRVPVASPANGAMKTAAAAAPTSRAAAAAPPQRMASPPPIPPAPAAVPIAAAEPPTTKGSHGGPVRPPASRPAPTSMPPAPPVSPAHDAHPPGAEPIEDMVRVSFARIAEQLPADLFRLGLDRLGANLLEPEYLLVPRRLVVPQLAEGLVQVPWPVVADQFPRQAMATPDADVAARLQNGSLLLPLDEIVRQVPPDLFVISAPSVDVRGLEDFPPPFQPHVPPPSAGRDDEEPMAPASDDVPADEPRAGEPTMTDRDITAAVAETTSGAEVAHGDPEAEDREPEALPELEPLDHEGAAAPVTSEQESTEPGTAEALVADDVAARLTENHELDALETTVPAPPEPTFQAPTFEAPRLAVLGPTVAPSEHGPLGDHRRDVDARRVAELFAPLPGAVAVETEVSGGTTLLTVVAPGLDHRVVVATARRVLPFLADARLPVAAAQATLRSDAGALVVTPLAPGEPEMPVLVAGAGTGASLALLERLSLAAAADWRAARQDWPALSAPAEPDARDGDLREVPVPADVRAMADSLRALGPVTPAVLRDADGRTLVYLFLRRGVAPRPLGSLARDLAQALEHAEIGRVESLVFRTGTDRLLVRTVESGRGGTTMLVAGGPVDRPGLARLELDRAAARLVAL